MGEYCSFIPMPTNKFLCKCIKDALASTASIRWPKSVFYGRQRKNICEILNFAMVVKMSREDATRCTVGCTPKTTCVSSAGA